MLNHDKLTIATKDLSKALRAFRDAILDAYSNEKMTVKDIEENFYIYVEASILGLAYFFCHKRILRKELSKAYPEAITRIHRREKKPHLNPEEQELAKRLDTIEKSLGIKRKNRLKSNDANEICSWLNGRVERVIATCDKQERYAQMEGIK